MMLTDLTKSNLLLVEDSADDAYFFRRALQKSSLNCTVNHLSDGAEAVRFLQNASSSDPQTFPKAMFLDLKMPVLNGFDVLDWLRNQTFRSQIRVIVLSGSEHQCDRDRATELGAMDYLVKPVKTSDLERLLRDVYQVKTEMGVHI